MSKKGGSTKKKAKRSASNVFSAFPESELAAFKQVILAFISRKNPTQTWLTKESPSCHVPLALPVKNDVCVKRKTDPVNSGFMRNLC